MGFFSKLLTKYALTVAEVSGFTMHKIMTLYSMATEQLYKGWNESAYNDLENARKMAEEESHWIEELCILLTEEKCMMENHHDPDLFYAANLRLKELHKVFDMPDDEFRSIFEERYLKGKAQLIQEQTFNYLNYSYDSLYVQSDYMAAHMNFMASILCSKAMGKIEMLTGNIAFKDRMERMFKMAVDYGYITNLEKAMQYYNEAIKEAKETKDMTFEYIGLMRKLSICLSSEHIANHINLDSETMSAVARLYEMCESSRYDPYSLGERLVKAEQEKARCGTKSEIKDAEWRINRLCEAMPMLYLQLALSRGDWQTARIYTEELKERELAAYGSCSDFSNSDLFMPLYAMLYNSEEREEAEAEQKLHEDQEDKDEPRYIDFPKGMFPIDKHRYLISLARNKMQQNHPLTAIALGEQAKRIALEMYSDYHMAMALYSIGQSYESAGNEEEALSYYHDVVKMLTEDAHPGSDATLSNNILYNTLCRIGNLTKTTNPKESIRTLSDAIGLLVHKSKYDMLYLENTLLTRAIAKSNIGDIAGKEKDCVDALDLIIGEAKKRLPYIEKELRENYWAEVSKQVQQIAAQVDEGSTPSFRKAVYNAILMAKGFMLSSEKAERKAVYNEESLREYIPLYKELEEYEVSKRPWGTMTENSAGLYVEHYLKSMKLQMVTKDFAGKYYDFMHIKFDSIVKALDEKDVVIDYYDYPIEDGDQQYVAFVYKKGMEAPAFAKACKESDLQKVYQEVTAKTYDDGTPYHISEAYNATWEYSARLHDLILKDIQERGKLTKDSRIWFIPSGSLHKIPVESLVTKHGTKTTVSDHHEGFFRISHARTLISTDDSNLNSIGLFGGLDYGGDKAEGTSERGYTIGMDKRHPTPLSSWGKLKQTLPEVRNISFLWQMTKGTDADICTGFDGTPEKFKELAEKGLSVLHLATHGFFETKSSKVNIPGLQGAYRPMDLTGIVLSNGNEGWLHGNNMHHEGILTATDIARMDMSKTRLVVLSACYTGEGTVRSDGVFGLQRAFKKAGASSIMMSLWSESDEAGAYFMSAFYSHLLSEGIDKRQAFLQAKQDTRKRFPHPMFWANFIMVD